jgi:hypothetical protein
MHRLIAAAALAWLGFDGSPSISPSRPSVLVELFTSEGCSSCPAADELLARLHSTQPLSGEVIALEFHVDYWDRLGWKDPFSSAAFTRRQQEYSRVFGSDRIYTPQMVVDGAAELIGSDEREAHRAIEKAAARSHLPLRVTARAAGGAVRLSMEAPARPPNTEPIDIFVALAEDGLTSVVKRGENSGRTLAHVAVVRRVEKTAALDADAFVAQGEWRLDPSWRRENLRAVAWLQGRKSHRVYGAGTAAVEDR